MSGPADNAAASTVGERLRAARNRQGLTLQKIAEELHLDTGVLEAMEGDRFRALGAPVFARGHLRKYAQTLGLDVDALLTDYEAAHAGPGAPSLVPTSVEHPVMVTEPGKSRFGAAAVWIAVILAASAVGGGWWWWHARPRHALDSAVADASAAPVAANQSASIETAPAQTSAKPAHPAPAAAQEEAASAGPVARLRMRFSADCWVEIYDATGRRLLFDQGSAGGARSVTGVPPLRVLLGNYAGVELTLDGRPVDVPQRSRTGATARFRVMPGGTTLSFWGS
jgi:cytoskeleton protein RodZ